VLLEPRGDRFANTMVFFLAIHGLYLEGRAHDTNVDGYDG
jgi:hypothetical protein